VPDDDRALMERLAALEAEVKADADAQRARKEAAMVKVREERAKAEAERAQLLERQAALVRRKPRDEEEAPAPSSLVRRKSRDDDDERDVDHGDGLAGALELAGKAGRLKGELAKRPAKGEKSWVKSGIASMALGPLGWLYAGSWREAVPASAAWLLVAAAISALPIPTFLLLPVLMVALPLSGIAGAVYAIQYNRTGRRQRLFGNDKKQLKSG
jgi:hypothetical protein